MFCLIIGDICFTGDTSCVDCPAFNLYADASKPDDISQPDDSPAPAAPSEPAPSL